MAIFHFHTGIIRASSGKCAVASAAYISGTRLYNDDARGLTFSYTHKEEVIFSEICLPENTPASLKDRQTLWNEFERVQNKANSRNARQFDMALTVELDTTQQIELARHFIQENSVAAGMAVDWALHNKPGNPHVHVMCTVRGFNRDRSWARMEKKVIALDADGNRIPVIDPKTEKQKVRARKGKEWEKKLWGHKDVQSNDWNSKQKLLE